MKVVPSDPGGMQVPDLDSVLLNHEGKPQPEELLPPAEVVKQRPIAATPPAPSPPATVAPAPAPAPAPLPPSSTPAPQATTVAASPPAAMVPQAKAAPTPTPTPALTAAGTYRLQLGALGSEDAAKQEWLRLQKQQPDVLGKLALSVSRVDLGAKGIYYRIQAGPIADATQAAQSCATLKSRNVGCIPVKP